MDENEKIQKLCLQYDPCARVISVHKVVGGLTHTMYRVQTDRATFAVKQLNPAIMRRADAYDNFVFSEKVARVACQNGINAVCALQFGGDVVHQVDGSFYMMFEWLDAQTLSAAQVDERHCSVIGQLLARLHNIGRSSFGNLQPKRAWAERFDFDRYVAPAHRQNKPFARDLQRSVGLLAQLSSKSAQAQDSLDTDAVVSHADLDCKNVMWQGLVPYVIDWEASGFVHPTLELVQVGWYWSGGDIVNWDPDKFAVLLRSYKREYAGEVCVDCAGLVCANMGAKLAWLDYNLQRSLTDAECDPAAVADSEVARSLNELIYCADRFDDVVQVLKNCL